MKLLTTAVVLVLTVTTVLAARPLTQPPPPVSGPFLRGWTVQAPGGRYGITEFDSSDMMPRTTFIVFASHTWGIPLPLWTVVLFGTAVPVAGAYGVRVLNRRKVRNAQPAA